MKRPSIQFYPADWRKDPALRACSIEARGLWIDMICIMHESENYGFLEINSRKISEKSLATMIGITPAKCRKFLAELQENGVFSVDDRGVPFSRRMVKDNELCEKRRASGKLGGNPALVKQNVNQTNGDLINHPHNQNQTPSSSSSSSSSSSDVPPNPQGGDDEWGEQENGAGWWKDDAIHAPCSEDEAVTYGMTLKISEPAIRHWWHTRNAAAWTKGSPNGAPARKISSWQSDLVASKRWAEEEAHRPASTDSPRKSRDLTSKDVTL